MITRPPPFETLMMALMDTPIWSLALCRGIWMSSLTGSIVALDDDAFIETVRRLAGFAPLSFGKLTSEKV